MSDLARHLATLAPEALAGLLAVRPDGLAEPRPSTLGELAARLESAMSARRALEHLDAHALVVAQIVIAHGDACIREDVLALLPELQEEARSALEVLQTYALVWSARTGEDTLLEPGGEVLRVAAGLRACFPRPLGLGPALADLLEIRNVVELQQLLQQHGLRAEGRKSDLVLRLVTWLTSATTLSHVVRTGPPGTHELLGRAIEEGQIELDYEDLGTGVYIGRRTRPTTPDRTPTAWLLHWGVLQRVDYDTAVLPRDVALALRREDGGRILALHVNPAPPPPPTLPVEPAAVERAAAGAATAFLDLARVLLETVAAAPPSALKTGGLGVREIRRLAKELGRDEDVVALTLTLLGAAGLVDATMEIVRVTPDYDAWLPAPPHERYAALASTWWMLPYTPTHVDPAEGKVTVLGRRQLPPGLEISRKLRHDVLGTLVGLGEGAAVAALESVVTWCTFHGPARIPIGAEQHAAALWREAESMGVVALQAAGPAARALVQGSVEDLLATAQRLVPSTGSTATFQADLTAMVSGSPSAEISALLASAADVESRGHATVWRFSPASVRRAMDTGARAADLLRELEAVAAVLPLPQPLTYLIRDVERRHGSLEVTPVACCVVSADQALVAEVAKTRSLTALRLRVLAPTVLASGAPANETLRALRAAGYAPVHKDADGQVVLERASSRPAAAQPGVGLTVRLPPGNPADEADTVAEAFSVAAALAGTGERIRLPAKVKGVDLNGRVVAQLGADGVRVLAWALETRGEIQLEYLDDRDTLRFERVRTVFGQSPNAVSIPTPDGQGRRGLHLGAILAVGPVVTRMDE